VGIGGRQTELSQIIRDFAALAYGGQDTQLWFDGRPVSAPGAALANGMTIDSLDMHDGYRPVKGHAGAALVPALLATLSLNRAGPVSGQEFLITLVMGYEVALRAGLGLHNTVCDYHTSGAWNALGCAAMTARRMKLTAEQTRHALGIAEYHGPRSQMMRCIDHPTMLKDGSGWGAMAGVSAAMMAASGFTGAPAITVEADEVAEYWNDLGDRWLTSDQYFKPYAVCYWAQPAIAGSLHLQHTHKVQLDEIKEIRVFAFHEATRLATRYPANTEQAQYSLPFPVAAALVHQKVEAAELGEAGRSDPQVRSIIERITLIEDDTCNNHFPQDRLSRVEFEMQDGTVLDSGIQRSKWDVDQAPPSDEVILEKFRHLAHSYLPTERANQLEALLWECDMLADASLLEGVLAPTL
ncbi:MAG: MmgE/PrpD family protein, partial [Chloroflexota bacterium]